MQRVNLQCKELADSVLARLEGTDGRDRPQLWCNRILAALRVAVSQSGNFGSHTFGCIAIRSALYLLALMKDARRSEMVSASWNDGVGEGEQAFEPVFGPAVTMTGGGVGDATGGLAGPEAYGSSSARDLEQFDMLLAGDQGGEAVPWSSKYYIEQEEKDEISEMNTNVEGLDEGGEGDSANGDHHSTNGH